MVEKVISSNEAKQRWGTVMREVAGSDDRAVVVESHGKPTAAVISYERFTELRRFERQRKTEQRLQRIRELEATYDGRNDNLGDDEIDSLADRFSREFVEDLEREGKIHFEQDREE
jgi:prevent-host-death family protein